MVMFDEAVVYVDIETSGASYKNSRIIEIAIIRVENNQIVDEYRTLVNPRTRLPNFITQITGITDDDLQGAPFFEEIAASVHAITQGAIFIAHNVQFDLSFIKRHMQECGYGFNPKLLCMVRLSRALYPYYKGHSLDKIVRRHSIKVENRHRAYGDATALKDFVAIAYKEHGAGMFNKAVARQLKTRTFPPRLDSADVDKLSKYSGVYIFENEEGQPIYIGKSINIRSRVLSHFRQASTHSKEMKLSRTTHKIRTIETGNELEALLLESKVIKELLPIFNKKLRRTRQQSVFMKSTNEQGYSIIELTNVDVSQLQDISSIYGVFNNKSRAKASLETILRTYQLCSKLLGLENAKEACFLYQLAKCKGACIGKESPSLYNARVEIALMRCKVEQWPYKSPILISIGNDSERAIVVDQWVVIGYLNSIADSAANFERNPGNFDIDTYRILRSFLFSAKKLISVKPISNEFLEAL